MTKTVEYKVAKWLMRHGSVKRKDAPKWFPDGAAKPNGLFHVKPGWVNAAGYSETSPDDEFLMTDLCIDRYLAERASRRKTVRENVSFIIAVVAFILSVFSIAWQIYTWREEKAASKVSLSTATTRRADLDGADTTHSIYLPGSRAKEEI